MNRLQELQDAASKRCGLPVSRRNVERLLAAYLRTSDLWKAIDYSDTTVPVAAALTESMLERGYLQRDAEDNLLLTPQGKQLAEDLEVRPAVEYTCPHCEGRGIAFWGEKELVERFLQVVKRRPEPIREYDQGSVTPETTLARVLLLEERGDLSGKDILIMGAEDDLTGLAVALTRKARRVLVLDIDERLIHLDNLVFRELGISNAEARIWDLREPFPAEWVGAFDVFVTDPPETQAAFWAFIARGIAALRGEGGAGYFGLTLRESSLWKWREFQRTLVEEWGAVITDIRQDFNAYMNWDYHEETRASRIVPVRRPPSEIWYRSAWYRIELVREPTRWNEPIQDEAFYQDAEGSTT